MRTLSMVFVAACMVGGNVSGATINVPADVRTIQSAINAAATGDTILVAPGTYTEAIVVNKDLTLRSSGGAAATVLRVGSTKKIVVTVSAGRTAATVIEGFTITGATLTTGGALTIQDASPVISRNIIRNNTTGQGGAALRVTSTTGMHAPTIVNNIIYSNTSTTSGGAVAVNNVGALLFAGNTVCGNSAATTGGGFQVEAGSANIQIVDCIFWANGASNLGGVTAAMISYCDVEGGAPEGGTGNIAVDPQFVNAASRNYHLLATSPCCDAGTTVAALTIDFDGDTRDATPDIGADEYRVPSVTGLTCTPDVLDVLLEWTNPWTGYTSIEIFRDGDPTAIATLAGTAVAYTDSSVAPGDHSYAVVAYYNTEASSPAECASVHVEVPPVTGLSCTLNGDVADLAWTNGYVYTNVRILREGAEVALLPGSAVSYQSTALVVGPNNFQVIGVLDGVSSDAAACTVELPLAPPYDLTCTAGTANLTVTLRWTNGDAYDSIEIRRNGTLVQTLAGAPTSFIDTLTAPGEYVYSVIGKIGTYASAAAVCTATVTYVPPVTNLLCPIGTDSIAHLTWTNGAANYTGIAITIDGVQAPGTPLTGSAQAYDSAVLAPGSHTFGVQPFIDVYQASPAACTAAAPLPPPAAFTCTPSTTSLAVALAWTNGWAYDSVVVRRGGTTIATLAGSATSYGDTVPAPGTYAYEVYGTIASVDSSAATCSAESTYVAPVVITQCTIGADRIARLAWTNGAANYTGIALLINGIAAPGSPLAGTVTSYTSAALDPGTYSFSVQPAIGTYLAIPRTCSATSPLPPPAAFTCSPSPTSLAVALAWTNGWAYESVVVRRGGTTIATLAGSATSYGDTVPVPGVYAYEVYGASASQISTTALCSAESTYVAPVTITQCTIDADRIAHLSWTNGATNYTSIVIAIDGAAQAPIAGTATSHTSAALAPGSHTFAVQPAIGTYLASPKSCSAAALLPPPTAFTCTPSTTSPAVALAWTNGWTYDSVVVRRGGAVIATLAGSATSYGDTVPAPGTYAYEVYGTLAAQSSTAATCSAESTYVAPVTITQCTIGADCIAHIAWTNGAANYTSIVISIDGAAQAPLAGTATSYTSAALAPGSHTFAVQPAIGAYLASPRTCTATAPVPPPAAFTCTPSTTSLAVALAWTNNWTYDSVVVRRGGTTIATLAGSATSYGDTVPAPGVCAYEVYGTVASVNSTAATCSAESTYVAPVTITQCTIGADRIARLAWTNGAANYTSITVSIDGVAQAPLAGTATAYASAALDLGTHTFAVQPAIGTYLAASRTCTATTPLPPPSAFTCTPSTTSLAVALAWTNGWAYDSVVVRRNGAAIATLAGSAASYADTVPAPGVYAYEVYGTLAAQISTTAACNAESTYVAPVTITQCTIGTDRIARLAWTNGAANYTGITLLINGVPAPGSPLAGTITSYTSAVLAPGAYTFTVQPSIGTYTASPRTCAATAPLPPPAAFTCTPSTTSLAVALAWTNGWTYNSVVVRRNGVTIATLQGSPTAYGDTVGTPGNYAYEIYGTLESLASTTATCNAEATFVAPAAITECTIGADRIAHLAWTNGVTYYDGITILIDGASAAGSPLPGATTTYTSGALEPGNHTFTVRPYVDVYDAAAATCAATAPLPPPSAFTCTANNLTVTLAWTNGWVYDSVVVLRDGVALQTLAGTSTTYVDTLSEPGAHAYGVYGTSGTLQSLAAICSTDADYVAPVTITQCTIGADRIARLAWTNGASNYTGIRVRIDGTAAAGSPLAGTATTYTSVALDPGSHAFSVQPYIDTYDAVPATCAATAPLPPPAGFTCTPAGDALTIALEWTNGWTYTSVVVLRDGAVVATLGGAATSYVDTLPAPGGYTYGVYGRTATQQSTVASCAVESSYVPPVAITQCTAGADRIARVAWTNGATNYTGIIVRIDGITVPQSPLPGTATSYNSAALAPGTHAIGIQPYIDEYNAIAATCSVAAPLPPPAGFTCTPSPTSLQVALAWTNGWTYDSVVVRRGGAVIATLAGSATSYGDTVPAPGTYAYEVRGTLGLLESVAATCGAEATYVAPVTITQCTIGADRIGRLVWTNGATNYTGIRLLIDGTAVAQSPLPGTATSYTSVALAPGNHTFSVQPYISTYNAVPATCTATAPLPPPAAFTCAASASSLAVPLAWTNGWTYTSVVVLRNGATIATLAGTATAYTDTLQAPGAYTYGVYGLTASQQSTTTACATEATYVAPVTITQCTIGADRIGRLAWTNGVANYTGIRVFIDGAAVAQSPLPGTATSYVSAALNPGLHAFTLQPYIGTYSATESACSATAPLPPPTAFTCTAAAGSLTITLAWTNGWTYDSVVIRRNGTVIRTVTGTTTSVTDTPAAPGVYLYEIQGVLADQTSALAPCTVEQTYVAPAAITTCAIDATRAAHLAWTNGAANYDGITLLVDGAAAAVSPLAGTATSCDIAGLVPGNHTFSLQPFIGAYKATAALCSATAPLPPPTGFTCTVGSSSLFVSLAWTNGWTYETVVILRNGTLLQTLAGSPASYTDTLPAPGAYTYAVYGTLGVQQSTSAACAVEATYVTPVTITQCAIGADRVARLAWTNGATNYTSIALLIDGVAAPESPLPGTATTYVSAVLLPGQHTFAVQPFIGTYQASSRSCTAEAPLPPPTNLVGTPDTASLSIALVWTNGWTYQSVVIRRNGAIIRTLSGSPASYTDTVPSPGTYTYDVYGTLGTLTSQAVSCAAEATYTAPVTITSCSFDTSRIAHLAWTNGAANYDGIVVLINGAAAPGSPLAGTATSYTSSALDPGPYTFSLRPYIGTYQAVERTCTAESPLPPPTGFTCTPGSDNLSVALAWTNGWAYDSVVVRRDGSTIATLTGTSTSYVDTLSAPGTHAYEIYGVRGTQQSTAATCSTDATYVAPVTITQCAIGADRIARLGWTNGAANYDGIALRIDGAAAPGSPLAGSAASYTSAALAPGQHTFEIQPFIGTYQASPRSCTAEAPLPPPTGLSCSAGAAGPNVVLAWTNGWSYASILVRRDGVLIATLAGTATAYTNTPALPGVYAYSVAGVLGTQTSTAALCSAELQYVAPLAITECTIGQDRIARLAWTNGATSYTGITLLIDGAAAPQSPLPGTTTSYVSAALVPGQHTFTLEPFIGTYVGAAASCAATAPLPPPTALACTAGTSNLNVALLWTNNWTYQSVVIMRNGAVIRTLSGSPSSYTDLLPAPGIYRYDVYGTLATQQSTAVACTTEATYVAPVAITQCLVDSSRIGRLAWTNGAANYDGIAVLIDGAAAAGSPLAGTATSYTSVALNPGIHTFALRPFIGAYQASAATCSAEALLPPPTGLTCAAGAGTLTVSLAWTNGWTYEQVVVRRGSATIATLPGTSTAYSDTLPAPGTYTYQVYGVLGSQQSTAASCSTEATYVAPVSITECSIDAARSTHLAWTNGAANYDGITVQIDGIVAATLGGSTTSFVTAALYPGRHTYSIRPFIGTYQAAAATCANDVLLPPPTNFACTPAPESWNVTLTWTNGWTYGSMTLLRNGIPRATLAGAPTSFNDTIEELGATTYELYGSVGTLNSATVTCVTEVTYVAPVTLAGCTVDASRVLHLSWTNGATPYDGIAVLLNGSPAPGTPLPPTATSYTSPAMDPARYTFSVRPFAGSFSAVPRECTGTAALPPPASLAAVTDNDSWAVDLSWTNGWPYDAVVIARNGVPLTTLPGTAVSYLDTAPALGAYTYAVHGLLGDLASADATVDIAISIVPPVAITQCTINDQRNALIAWTNAVATYEGIHLRIDGTPVPESPLPGSFQSYTSAPLGPGEHTITVQPFIGAVSAEPRICSPGAPLPAPYNLTCTPDAASWRVALAWTNAWAYTSVTVVRNGAIVVTLAGSPRTYTDTVPAPGFHTYEVYGTVADLDSDSVSCATEVTYVPPVAALACAFDAARIAHVTWVNGAANYGAIELLIDGAAAPESPLDGGVMRYDSAPLVPGTHTFALRPSIGAYRAAAAQVIAVSPLPPVSGLTCTAGTNNWRITLSWTVGWTYDAVVIVRDGAQITSLAGTASSYTDNLAGPGAYAYEVRGVLAGQASLGAPCSAEIVYVPPVTLTQCQIGQDRVARLVWTNGASTYDRIDIFLDGAAVPESPLPGTTTAYTSVPLIPGVHTLAVRPAIGTYLAAPRECTGTAIVPAPTNLACTVPADSWRVALSWTNNWGYESITVIRNGAAIAALAGTATSYVDVAPALGNYKYEVLGVFSGQNSAAASCTLNITVVPPVTLTLCEIDEARAAHLAWTLGDAVYSGIEVLIDATLAATLPGNATSYDSAVLAPGAHTFAVRPFAGATRAANAVCSAEAPPPPPAGLQCSLRPTLWTVNLTWTNPFVYEQVRILRNDEEIFSGAGTTTSFIDHTPRPGVYAYKVLGCLDSRCSDPATCTIELTEVPPVSIGQCNVGEDRVLHLAWTNGFEGYDGIALLIDNAPAPESPLPGTAVSYVSAPLVPGVHTFTLKPFIGAYQAAAATCSGTAALPMPTAFTCATIGESWDVNLTWVNGWQYGSVTILRDGMPVATITGAPTNYVDTVFAVGTYEYNIYGSLGALNSATATCAAEITLVPPVEITRCEIDAESKAQLAWSSSIDAYDGIDILIDGTAAADSPLPGTAVTYVSAPLGPGSHTFTIQAFIGTHRSDAVSCESFGPPPPPTGLVCAGSNSNMQVTLTWTNGWTYDSITIYRNSVTIATLPGADETYTDTVDVNGSYAYIVAGVLGDKESQSEGCIVRVTYVPKPEQLTCESVGMTAELAWVNPIVYDEIEVMRDGATLGVYSGDTQSIQDALPDEAPHEYCVIGRLGRYASDCATCTVQAGGVRPFVRGDVNADGIVNIADPIYLLGYLFRSDRGPTCMESANVNNDTKLDIADAIYVLGYMFREDDPPPPPFPDCGYDIEGGNYLGCDAYPTCP